MRIISRTEFLAQPAGTLFFKWPAQGATTISIKAETIPEAGDYFELDFTLPIPVVNGEPIMPGDDVPVGESFAVEYCQQRDGFFDQEQQFCIYEQADVEQFMVLLCSNLRYVRDSL